MCHKHVTDACVYGAVAIVVAIVVPIVVASDLRPKTRRKSITNPRVYVAVAIVVAIVAAPDLRPNAVAQVLHMHALSALPQLLLQLLSPRICDPKPSQTRYKSTCLRRCRHCCCHCCCPGFTTQRRRKNVTNPHIYVAVAIVVAIVVAPDLRP